MNAQLKILITEQAFNPWAELQAYEQSLQALHGQCGAAAVFVGTMRDFNEGDGVKAMFLEHYPQMTEKYLQKISLQALNEFSLLDTLIIHRVGEILPNDTIVLTAAWSAHRAAAFAGCRLLIESLKTQAPFWKHETLNDNTMRWVEKNTPAE
ncbi:molybdopterin converting factor, large subunit [Beggiatoa alba B18LD]|uniref:Molybdopterin synthase catalytic subunit n=1 Tax=Beggiatoa alba B18LD TaxID=395493 RepID=I3CHA6_9GAMM|nr:molybdenum cofactor biosynthesis protein MoaE [Beggiatoa alba]EIJ42999.1 molybdopterin converting factor, large subunit [Beggiatoa alba B18LD]